MVADFICLLDLQRGYAPHGFIAECFVLDCIYFPLVISHEVVKERIPSGVCALSPD